jgi:hypothetical protein
MRQASPEKMPFMTPRVSYSVEISRSIGSSFASESARSFACTLSATSKNGLCSTSSL